MNNKNGFSAEYARKLAVDAASEARRKQELALNDETSRIAAKIREEANLGMYATHIKASQFTVHKLRDWLTGLGYVCDVNKFAYIAEESLLWGRTARLDISWSPYDD